SAAMKAVRAAVALRMLETPLARLRSIVRLLFLEHRAFHVAIGEPRGQVAHHNLRLAGAANDDIADRTLGTLQDRFRDDLWRIHRWRQSGNAVFQVIPCVLWKRSIDR